MKFRIIALLIVVAVVMTASFAVAQKGRGGQGMGMGSGQSCGLGLGLGVGPNVVNELNLTQTQISHLQKITDQFVSDTQTLRSSLQTKCKELAQLWTAESPKETTIKSKIAEIDSVRSKIRNAMVDITFAVMKVLTSEQKTKLRSLVKNRPGFGAGMGCGLGMGYGPGCNCMMNGMCGQGAGRGQGYRGGRGNK